MKSFAELNKEVNSMSTPNLTYPSLKEVLDLFTSFEQGSDVAAAQLLTYYRHLGFAFTPAEISVLDVLDQAFRKIYALT